MKAPQPGGCRGRPSLTEISNTHNNLGESKKLRVGRMGKEPKFKKRNV